MMVGLGLHANLVPPYSAPPLPIKSDTYHRPRKMVGTGVNISPALTGA